MAVRDVIQAAAGALGGDKLYVEDVFSTYLYTGNWPTQTITNGIDLAGEGGLVWTKNRVSDSLWHNLEDTERGANQNLASNNTGAQFTDVVSPYITSFNSNGYSLGEASGVNFTGDKFVSWTFRKARKFFDVVTYTGTGSVQNIPHNLGSVPGCIIVKGATNTGSWRVYHRSLNGGVTPERRSIVLNTTAAELTLSTVYWNNTAPTATEFTVGTGGDVNSSGQTFVAYLFAHDAGGFGDDGEQNVISCGSYTANTSSGVTVDLGWEPQWLLVKNTGAGNGHWAIIDNMRSFTVNATSNTDLYANANYAEIAPATETFPIPTATGFKVGAGVEGEFNYNSSGSTGTPQKFIYIAIRRGPMKTPTSGTEVFNVNAYSGTGATRDITGIGFPLDANLTMRRETHTFNIFVSRLQGLSCNGSTIDTPQLATNATDSELTGVVNGINATSGSAMDGYTIFNAYSQLNASGGTYASYSFRRAPGFFDVVAYTGTGVNNTTIYHNLAAVPELLITKRRNSDNDWYVGVNLGSSSYSELFLNSTSAATSVSYNPSSSSIELAAQPTATAFFANDSGYINRSGDTYVAYLFASCPGVSKCGSYTGTGTTQQINCGFTAGARFVLIKRTDSTGSWYVWDVARGISSGNDPYLLLNSTAAEVTSTDYIDAYSAGFEISSTAPSEINENGGSFIFFAVA